MTRTATGPNSSLGVVAMGEHLLYGLYGWQDDPSVAFDRPKVYEALAAALREFKQAGGGTLLDVTPICSGRNPEMVTKLSESTGVNIVCCSGLGAERFVPGYFLAPDKFDAEYLAAMFTSELMEGMPASGMILSKAKCAMLSAESSAQAPTRLEELALLGAAYAARRTGAPVLLRGLNQARQFNALVDAGVAPERIVIGHCDDARSLDMQRNLELARRGATLSFDHVGWEEGAPHAMPDERRAAMVKDMLAAGFGGQVVLACGAIGCGLGVPASRHRFAHLLTDFVPRLEQAGVAGSAIERMLIENPARLLDGEAILPIV